MFLFYSEGESLHSSNIVMTKYKKNKKIKIKIVFKNKEAPYKIQAMSKCLF